MLIVLVLVIMLWDGTTAQSTQTGCTNAISSLAPLPELHNGKFVKPVIFMLLKPWQRCSTIAPMPLRCAQRGSLFGYNY